MKICSSKFATGVNTGGASWLANISANFQKNSIWSYFYYQELGRWFMKKTWSKKSRDTVPLKWTWRQKFIYMLTLLPKGVQKKLLKFFCLKVFSICHRCHWHRWQTLSRPRIFWKIRNGPFGIIRGLGETDSRKKPEAKNLVTLSL